VADFTVSIASSDTSPIIATGEYITLTPTITGGSGCEKIQWLFASTSVSPFSSQLPNNVLISNGVLYIRHIHTHNTGIYKIVVTDNLTGNTATNTIQLNVDNPNQEFNILTQQLSSLSSKGTASIVLHVLTFVSVIIGIIVNCIIMGRQLYGIKKNGLAA